MDSKYPQEEYNIREAKGDDFYRIMIVNTALSQFQFKTDFPFILVVEIDIKDTTDRFKLPTEAEAIILNHLEDTIREIVKANSSYQYVGRTTDNGVRALYCHIANPKSVHEGIQQFIDSGLNTHEFNYNIEKDIDWESTKFFFS